MILHLERRDFRLLYLITTRYKQDKSQKLRIMLHLRNSENIKLLHLITMKHKEARKIQCKSKSQNSD